MSTIASKNLYDLLGNDPDQDPELRTEPPPVAPVDKPVARKGKRDAPAEAPVAPPTGAPDAPRGRGRGRGGRGGGRGRRGAHQDGFGGNEEAFQDPEAGSFRNRDKPTDDGFQEERRGGRGRGGGFEGRGRGRGGRGGRGGAPRDDRHSRTIHSGPDDQAKQAAKGWGDETGAGELRDEQAGEAIAQEESKQGYDSVVEKPVNAEGENPVTDQDEGELEPEDKTKSYSDYLAEQAEKKLQLGGNLEARKANEGSSNSLPEGKAIEKEGEAEYFAGTGGKARRERERKEKNTYVLEHDIQAREQPAARGGRGGRGGRGVRGEGRARGPGGRGGARGDTRGRGGRGSSGIGGPAAAGGPSPNVTNAADFPTLGS